MASKLDFPAPVSSCIMCSTWKSSCGPSVYKGNFMRGRGANSWDVAVRGGTRVCCTVKKPSGVR